MNKRIGKTASICAGLVLGLACGAGMAQNLGQLGGSLGGGLGGMLPGGGSMTSGSKSNVAGLLQYCVQNNYLGGASGASGIKDKLLGGMGGHQSASTSDAGYMSGAKGILQTGNGKSVNLGSVGGGSSDMKSKITTKVCDSVLKQGKSFAGM